LIPEPLKKRQQQISTITPENALAHYCGAAAVLQRTPLEQSPQAQFLKHLINSAFFELAHILLYTRATGQWPFTLS
jgi:hypothetical protein